MPPVFTPKESCPFKGTYQLSVSYTTTDCVGNTASVAVASGDNLQLKACQGPASSQKYKASKWNVCCTAVAFWQVARACAVPAVASLTGSF